VEITLWIENIQNKRKGQLFGLRRFRESDYEG